MKLCGISQKRIFSANWSCLLLQILIFKTMQSPHQYYLQRQQLEKATFASIVTYIQNVNKKLSEER